MPNIATLLKAEISRISRKEIRAETDSLKSSTASHRTDIAALKRRADALEREIRRLRKVSGERTPSAEAPSTKLSRYSAKSLTSQRRRLGLSASDCGLLLGASAQSIYNWEEDKVRPHAKHLPKIAHLKTLGRRQVAEVLDGLRASAA